MFVIGKLSNTDLISSNYLSPFLKGLFISPMRAGEGEREMDGKKETGPMVGSFLFFFK